FLAEPLGLASRFNHKARTSDLLSHRRDQRQASDWPSKSGLSLCQVFLVEVDASVRVRQEIARGLGRSEAWSQLGESNITVTTSMKRHEPTISLINYNDILKMLRKIGPQPQYLPSC